MMLVRVGEGQSSILECGKEGNASGGEGSVKQVPNGRRRSQESWWIR